MICSCDFSKKTKCSPIHSFDLVRFCANIYSVFLDSSSTVLSRGLSWSWSYGGGFYNYLCNQCLTPLKLWVRTTFMARSTRYNITWYGFSVTCDRSVVFSGYSGFFHQLNWPPRYNWNIVSIGLCTWKCSYTAYGIFCLSFYYLERLFDLLAEKCFSVKYFNNEQYICFHNIYIVYFLTCYLNSNMT